MIRDIGQSYDLWRFNRRGYNSYSSMIRKVIGNFDGSVGCGYKQHVQLTSNSSLDEELLYYGSSRFLSNFHLYMDDDLIKLRYGL